MSFDRLRDASVRSAAFEWLAAQVSVHGDVLARKLLAKGFVWNARRVPLVGPQGIFKPAVLNVPLSLTTVLNGPYDDAFGPHTLRYRYRGTDPFHRDNVGLRVAMRERLPLVYFHGVVPGRYLASWPVFIVGDDPGNLAFAVAVDDAAYLGLSPACEWKVGEGAAIRRHYVTSMTRRRLHQRAFRERVLRAYRHQCALCRLRHDELLDAAHITPDAEVRGDPVVSNGLALCHLHHRAFDKFFLSVRPDYVIEVRADVLRERDGPTLRYAIQGLHGRRISTPRREELRPSVLRLEERYERFRQLAERL